MIAFVTGAVGPSLDRLLLREGATVRALVHPTPPGGLQPEGVHLGPGDLDDAATIAEGVRGADVVFHLAAKLHVNNPGPELAA